MHSCGYQGQAEEEMESNCLMGFLRQGEGLRAGRRDGCTTLSVVMPLGCSH